MRRGEIYAFLGPSGASKTTTIRMLLGLLRPTEGEAFVLGKSTRTQAEAIRPQVDWQALARRFFTLSEVQQLDELPAGEQLSAFFRIWTGKEAYLKACGAGLSLPLRTSCRRRM